METPYNDALERAKQAIIDCGSNAGRKEMIYGIFPELREWGEAEAASATDEKIRKELSAFLWDVANGSFKSMPSASMCQKWAVYLNKQKEQYPVKWSEEDEIRLKEALEVLDESIKHLPIGYGYTKDVRLVKDWLESLRPQPGFSKEDFIKFGNREYERGRQDGIQFAERTHWKPSEQQVTDLRLLLDDLDNLNTRNNVKMIKVFHWSLNYENLKNLLNDLKKLI